MTSWGWASEQSRTSTPTRQGLITGPIEWQNLNRLRRRVQNTLSTDSERVLSRFPLSTLFPLNLETARLSHSLHQRRREHASLHLTLLRQYPPDMSPVTKPTQVDFNPYAENGGTILAIAGLDFAVVAGDTRQTEGYSIQTRYAPKVFRLCVLHSLWG